MNDEVEMTCHKMRFLDWLLIGIILFVIYMCVFICIRTMEMVSEQRRDMDKAMQEYGYYLDNEGVHKISTNKSE